ncbi:uncharacterized protein KZ484_011003 [Pholidichthys leucotaenia]
MDKNYLLPDAPWLHDCKEEEVLTVQQLCNQERKFSLDQEEQDAAHVKEEEEELCTSQEEEHFGLKRETDTFMVTPTDEDNDKSETVPNSEQQLSHNSPDTESQDQGAEDLHRVETEDCVEHLFQTDENQFMSPAITEDSREDHWSFTSAFSGCFSPTRTQTVFRPPSSPCTALPVLL